MASSDERYVVKFYERLVSKLDTKQLIADFKKQRDDYEKYGEMFIPLAEETNMANEEYEDVSDDQSLTLALSVTWEPVSRFSQYARIENGRDTYVLYVNSKMGIHRGAMFKNGDVIKSSASFKLDGLKKMLEDLVINDARA